MQRPLIIAMDGPSGAGKSTLSRMVADRLGYLNIDTGAMYRSVALAARRKGVDPEDEEGLQALVAGLDIAFLQAGSRQLVLLNGEDVSQAIRQPEISLLTSKVAASAAVRQELVRLQRRLGAAGGVILEGRDIGSVVFPTADLKLYLNASSSVRGRRRYAELRALGEDVDLEQTIADVEARDRADMNRSLAPLIKPADAIEIDSDHCSVEQVLKEILSLVEAITGNSGKSSTNKAE